MESYLQRGISLGILVGAGAVGALLITFHRSRVLSGRVIAGTAFLSLAGVPIWLATGAGWLGAILVALGGGTAMAILVAGLPSGPISRSWRVVGLTFLSTSLVLLASCALDFPSRSSLGTFVDAVGVLAAFVLVISSPWRNARIPNR